MQTTSYAGLTLEEVVAQSAAIHPDWDANEHAHYLTAEEGFSETYVSNWHSAIVDLILRHRSLR